MADRMQAVRARVCAAIALLALGAGLAIALSHASPRRSGGNGVVAATQIAEATAGSTLCQPGEVLPSGTASLRIAAARSEGSAPGLLVTLRRRGRVLDRAPVAPGWRDEALSVPIRRTTREYDDVEICVRIARGGGGVAFEGDEVPAYGASSVLDGDKTEHAVRIDYYRPGRESWWSFAPTLARRFGFDRGGWGGPWIAGLAAALLLASLALTGRVLLRTIVRDERPGATRRVPATALTLALIGFLNAAAWSLVTPAFLVPDEINHTAYAALIGETGRPPVSHGGYAFPPEIGALVANSLSSTRGVLYRRRVFTPLEERRLQLALRQAKAEHVPRVNGDAGDVDPEPPLYYALEAIPYRLAHGTTLPQRMALMRLLSAALAGVTVLFVFLFVRECLPARRWAWSVGALAAAFLPMLGFISGGVNPDALLFAVCAALFSCLARAFRRGLTTRLAVALGAAFGIGMVAKINFYGLAPGAAIAIVLAARHGEGAWNRRVLGRSALALGVGLAPYALVTLLEGAVWSRPFVLAHRAAAAHDDHGGLVEQLGFLWQVYLPRLPGQTPAFESWVGYQLWFRSFAGNFGWLDVPFPEWAYGVALAALTGIGALALRAAAVERAALRRRGLELAGYLLMIAGLLALIAMVALRGFAPNLLAAVQGRYLLPLLALFAALLALAARGAGAAWGRAAGVVIVIAFVAWSLFAQLVAIAGFYG